MSRGTVIDEMLGEISYHTTLEIDGVKYKVVDFQQIPHPSSDGYQYSLYRYSRWVLSADTMEDARKYLRKKNELRRFEQESVRVADPE